MAERICTDPTLFEKSQGRSVCNARFAGIYKDNNICGQCPKASRAISAKDKISDAKTTMVKPQRPKYEH